MPGFGGDSPSLRKMELNNGKYGGASGKKFNFANIAGDPFSLATIGIAVVSAGVETCVMAQWLILGSAAG